MSKLVGFGSDGAANMQGAKSGVGVRLRSDHPEIVLVKYGSQTRIFIQRCYEAVQSVWQNPNIAIRPILSSETDIITMNSVFVCVDNGQEFYVKAHLLRHTLVHKACKYCGKTSPHRKCIHVSSPNITKQDALKPFMHSYHYKMHLN